MSLPTVTLYVDSNGTHLHQVYAGLDLLSREGAIDLKLRPGTKITKNRPNRQFIALRLEFNNSRVLAVFDLQDSPEIGVRDALKYCDYYFKRSLSSESYKGLSDEESKKLNPFGFNYQVIVPSKSMVLKRILIEYLSRPFNPFRKKNNFHLHNLKELLDANFGIKESPLMSVNDLKPKKSANYEFDVLFQCRLWDPNDLAKRNREDAEKINAERISLVSALKQELGNRFVGGLQPTDFAKKAAPDLIVNSSAVAHRRRYIDLVKASAVVISSAGLLGSNGWKLGEYVSLGKAIISEPITTRLPGKFENGVHYQSYTSVDDCMDKVTNLLNSPEEINSMSVSVAEYYASFLEPKALMNHHLNTMLEKM